MNDFISILILAVIQGITEWFPISSSGHLVLFSKILGHNNSVAFDVALHFGTLMAVFVYFGRDITNMMEAVLKGKFKTPEGKMALLLVVGSIPAAVIGFAFKSFFESIFNEMIIVAVCLLITGAFLFIASISKSVNGKKLGYRESLWIGLAQAFSIFPGISRSGATISTGLLAGLDEKEAVRFSFLLSIPAIFGASIIEIGNNKLPPEFIGATIVSFIVGMITIHLLLKILVNSRRNLVWFGIYCLIIGLVMLGYLLFL